MKFRSPVICMIFFCLGLVATAQESRPKVAIKTFRNPSNYSHSTIGDGLTDMLTTELQNTGKFDVLERSHVDELTKEMDFGSSGYGNKDTFAQKGNLLGAQYFLMGEVTNFSYTEQRGAPKRKVNLLGPNTIVTEFQKQADVRVDFHFVDVSTGETVISQAGEGHASATSEVSELDTWRLIISGSGTFESSSSLIGRATTDAVKDIVRKLNSLSEIVKQRSENAAIGASLNNLMSAKGEIAGEEGGGLWIIGGLGSANGLKAGDHLRVVHENLVKDKTGKVIYRKPIDIGLMEITDVSQTDHAEARFLPTAGGVTASPQTSDTVTVDVEYAKTIRGAGPSPSGSTPGASGSSAPVVAPSGQLEETIKRADSYLHDKFWAQALDEYNQAAKINANEPRVLQGQALSHYMLGDFLEGDEFTDKLLQAGGSFSFPIAHFHSMGICIGELKIQKGKLAYASDKGDGFDVDAQGLGEIEVKKISKGMMANEKLPDWPMMNIRFRDSGGHEKDYQMLPYGYSKEQTLSGKNLASAFPMGDSDVQEMQKFEESMAALIQKYVK